MSEIKGAHYDYDSNSWDDIELTSCDTHTLVERQLWYKCQYCGQLFAKSVVDSLLEDYSYRRS